MFDVRFLFTVLVVTNLVLAGSLWIGTGRSHRDGLGHWTAGLVMQALAFSLFAARGEVPSWLGVVLANGLLASSLSLAAGAMAAFRYREVSYYSHVAFGMLAALAAAAFVDDDQGRTVACGLLYCLAKDVTLRDNQSLLVRLSPNIHKPKVGYFFCKLLPLGDKYRKW